MLRYQATQRVGGRSVFPSILHPQPLYQLLTQVRHFCRSLNRFETSCSNILYQALLHNTQEEDGLKKPPRKPPDIAHQSFLCYGPAKNANEWNSLQHFSPQLPLRDQKKSNHRATPSCGDSIIQVLSSSCGSSLSSSTVACYTLGYTLL